MEKSLSFHALLLTPSAPEEADVLAADFLDFALDIIFAEQMRHCYCALRFTEDT